MSSHHFVKEQQEPAVFILNTHLIKFDQVASLLEWVPTLLVCQESVDEVLSWGVKIDVILATEEFQRKNLSLLEQQYPLRFLTCNPQEFLAEGLHYLHASGHSGAHLVGFAHQHVSELDPFIQWMDLTVFENQWRFYPIKSTPFKKWLAAGTIEIYGKEGMPIEIENSNGNLILPIHYATMVEVPEGITEFRASSIFWIGESL
ncbi:thiamine pyrophosphokinase [Algoriphagus sp.]|uniref:thiamine pyrophosphokinase n=1 Tax=Algoriphagus sp. TaxID=1872435 RepID=UPI002604E8AB|nr:thiamine pyrophosphokinase [Algoriphagus sp.]